MPARTMRAGALAALLAGAAALAGPLVGPPKAILLRYRFRAGQVVRYRATVNVRVEASGAEEPPTMSGSGVSTLKVLKVEPDGSAQITGTHHAETGGPSGDTIRYTLSPLGRMRDVRLPGLGSVPMMGRLMNPDALSLMPALLPARAVRPGDRWVSTMPNPLQGGRPVTVSTRFAQVETVNGLDTARLQQYFVVPVRMKVSQGRAVSTVSGEVRVNSTANFATGPGLLARSALIGRGAIRFTPAGPPSPGAGPAVIRLRLNGTLDLIR